MYGMLRRRLRLKLDCEHGCIRCGASVKARQLRQGSYHYSLMAFHDPPSFLHGHSTLRTSAASVRKDAALVWVHRTSSNAAIIFIDAANLLKNLILVFEEEMQNETAAVA